MWGGEGEPFWRKVPGHFLCKRCGKIYDLMCNNNIKKVADMDMDGHDVQEIHYYYKGICKHCIEEERLRTTKNN